MQTFRSSPLFPPSVSRRQTIIIDHYCTKKAYPLLLLLLYHLDLVYTKVKLRLGTTALYHRGIITEWFFFSFFLWYHIITVNKKQTNNSFTIIIRREGMEKKRSKNRSVFFPSCFNDKSVRYDEIYNDRASYTIVFI